MSVDPQDLPAEMRATLGIDASGRPLSDNASDEAREEVQRALERMRAVEVSVETIDATCSSCRANDAGTYRTEAECRNCGWRGEALHSAGHEKADSNRATCPRCECRSVHMGGFLAACCSGQRLAEHASPAGAVRAFHEAFDLVVRDEVQAGGLVDVAERDFRVRLMIEEIAELLCAMLGTGIPAQVAEALCVAIGVYIPEEDRGPQDPAEVAREMSDVLNVVYGAALHYGFDLDAAFDEVMASCMRKLGPDGQPIRRDDGKVLKPEGWEPPDVAKAIGLEARG